MHLRLWRSIPRAVSNRVAGPAGQQPRLVLHLESQGQPSSPPRLLTRACSHLSADNNRGAKPPAQVLDSILESLGSDSKGAKTGFSALRTSGRAQRRATLRQIERDLLARKSGPSSSEYTKLIVEYGKATPGGWRDAVRVLNSVPANRRVDKQYCACIAVCGRAKAWRAGLEVYEGMAATDATPTLHVFNAVINAAAKGGQWRRCLSLLEEMEGRGLPPDGFTYNAVISGLGRAGQWEKAVETFEGVLREMGRGAGTVSAESARYTFCAVISALARAGQWEKALVIFSDMKLRGIEPDIVVYSAVIAALEKGGQWEQALALFTEMRQRGKRPDVVACTTVISALGKGAQWKKALRLFGEMGRDGVAPNVQTYSALISALDKGGQWEKALALLDEMSAEGVVPNVVTYGALISSVCKAGRWRRALALFGVMKEGGVRPNLVVYSAVIDAVGKGGRWEQALRLFGEMQADGVTPNVMTYTSLIGALARVGQWQEALGQLDAMREKGVAPNVVTYSALISAMGAVSTKATEHAQGHEQEQEQDQQWLASPQLPQSLELPAEPEPPQPCEPQWERALELFAEMKAAGIVPNHITYNALLSVMADAGQTETAVALFEEMQALSQRGADGTGAPTVAGVLKDGGSHGNDDSGGSCEHHLHLADATAPDAVTYSALIRAFGKAGQWERAVEAFDGMAAGGVVADQTAYLTLIHALESCGQMERAVDMADEMSLLLLD
jgi:pentatricopeptide repeat domain-containing protein 1